MNVQRMTVGGVEVLTLSGDLTAANAQEVQETLFAVASANSRVLIDLSDVTYLTSIWLRLLLTLSRRMAQAGGRVVFVVGDSAVDEVFQLTGLSAHLRVEHTREAGLKALQMEV
jgi:anti-sigma B factor antagonist